MKLNGYLLHFIMIQILVTPFNNDTIKDILEYSSDISHDIYGLIIVTDKDIKGTTQYTFPQIITQASKMLDKRLQSYSYKVGQTEEPEEVYMTHFFDEFCS